LDAVRVEVAAEHVGHALAERMVDALRMVDVDAEPLLARELQREHLDPAQGRFDRPSDLALQLSFLLLRCRRHRRETTPSNEKWARRAHLENCSNCGGRKVAEPEKKGRGAQFLSPCSAAREK